MIQFVIRMIGTAILLVLVAMGSRAALVVVLALISLGIEAIIFRLRQKGH